LGTGEISVEFLDDVKLCLTGIVLYFEGDPKGFIYRSLKVFLAVEQLEGLGKSRQTKSQQKQTNYPAFHKYTLIQVKIYNKAMSYPKDFKKYC
jgi:hypothetical protein